jgi:hypothetical protein
MNARSLKILDVRLPQDPSHLTANNRNQIQLFMHIPLFVMQPRRKDVRITTEQCWVVFNKHPLHPICVDRFEISDVTHNLLNRPLARDRLQTKLIVVCLQDGISKKGWP